jgi:mRNA-degrading endonuclease YafQ of YafQ-DinJ toxin-antitoxin module
MEITVIYFSSHFKRAMKTLPKELRVEINERAEWFKKDCFDSRLRTHKLSGKLKGLWSFSLTQKHRVLFHFMSETEVGFDDVGDHNIYN